MVRVKLIGGSHFRNGQRWDADDVLEVTEQEYEDFEFKFQRLPDEAGREPLDKEITDALAKAWSRVYVTTPALQEALRNDLLPDEVEGTGKDGRVVTRDVRRALGKPRRQPPDAVS